MWNWTSGWTFSCLLKVYSGFGWADGVLLSLRCWSNIKVKHQRMVTALTGIEMSQESLQLNNPYLLMVLVPFKHSLSYISHIQFNSVTTFPSAFVLFSDFNITAEILT